MVRAAYLHGVVVKVPPRTGFGEALNVLHRTVQQCGDYKTNTRHSVDLDEWVRFGFKDQDATYQFRAEAERIAPGFTPQTPEWSLCGAIQEMQRRVSERQANGARTAAAVAFLMSRPVYAPALVYAPTPSHAGTRCTTLGNSVNCDSY